MKVILGPGGPRINVKDILEALRRWDDPTKDLEQKMGEWFQVPIPYTDNKALKELVQKASKTVSAP